MKTFARNVIHVGAVALAVTISLFIVLPATSDASPAPELRAVSAFSPAVTGSSSKCSDVVAQSGGVNSTCSGPNDSTIGTNCTPFPNGQQWQDYIDGNGVPSQWTYSNGSQACVRVTYHVTVTNTSCSFWFYIPRGHATANIFFGWWDGNEMKHFAATVNEDPVDGWQQLNMSPSSNDAPM